MKISVSRRVLNWFKGLIHSRRFSQTWMGKDLSMIQLMELDACTIVPCAPPVVLLPSLLKGFQMSIFFPPKKSHRSRPWLRAGRLENVRSGIFKKASISAPIATVAQWFVR